MALWTKTFEKKNKICSAELKKYLHLCYWSCSSLQGIESVLSGLTTKCSSSSSLSMLSLYQASDASAWPTDFHQWVTPKNYFFAGKNSHHNLPFFYLPTGNLMIDIKVRNRLYENLPLVPNLHQLNLGPASYGYTPDLFRFCLLNSNLEILFAEQVSSLDWPTCAVSPSSLFSSTALTSW